MRHNQNARHMRGRRSGGGHSGGGGGGSHHHNVGGNSGGGNGGQQRRVNPRVQTFDSNGPEVRIRGNAFQITEKYLTLARDATSAGDRILAESYFQHAEHYQRMINEMNEEYARQNPGYTAQQPFDGGGAAQPDMQGQPQPQVQQAGQPQPGMNDLDQGFLVGPRTTSTAPVIPAEQPEDSRPQQTPQRASRHKETETL